MTIAAVIFDMDGVIIDSEHVWDEARRQLAEERGGRWTENASHDMMGMSSPEWSRYMHDVVGLPQAPDEINAEVVRRLEEIYGAELPLLPGAVDAVRRIGARWPLGLASSSNRPLIDLVLELAGLTELFLATVSSEEVARGKPSPDVYLETAARMDVDPASCVAIEDSDAGIRSAQAAGMTVVALPNPGFPPSEEALGLATVQVESPAELTPALLEGSLARRPADPR